MKIKTSYLISVLLIVFFGSAPSVSSQETTTIRLELPSWGNQYLVQEAVDSVMAMNPDLNIQVDFTPFENYGLTGCRGMVAFPNTVMTELTAGAPPDIVLVESSDMSIIHDRYGSMISPMPDYVLAHYADDLGAFPSAINALQTGAVPFASWHYMTIYNVNALNRAGAGYPNLFPTWKEMISLNEELLQSGIKMGFLDDPALAASFVFNIDGQISASVMPGVWQERADLYASDVDALTQASNTYATNFGTLVDDFVSGETAVVLTESGFLNALKAREYSDPVAFSALPTLEVQSAYSSTNFVLGALVFDTGRAEAAWRVADGLFSHPSMIRWAAHAGYLPASVDGFSVFADSIVQDIWPESIADASAANYMSAIAANSLTWVLPPAFGPDTHYADVVYPVAQAVMRSMINDNLSLGETIWQVIDALGQLDQ